MNGLPQSRCFAAGHCLGGRARSRTCRLIRRAGAELCTTSLIDIGPRLKAGSAAARFRVLGGDAEGVACACEVSGSGFAAGDVCPECPFAVMHVGLEACG